MNEAARARGKARGFFVGMTIGVLAAAAFSGCGGEREPSGKKKEVKREKASERPAGDTGAKIEDFFAWYAFRQRYRASNKPSAETEAFLAAKEQDLRKQHPPQRIEESIEIVAFNWQIQGEKPEEGKPAPYVASWILRRTGEIKMAPGQKILFLFRTEPDKAHWHYFPESKHPEYQDYIVSLEPGIEDWDLNEYHLVKRPVQTPVLPYKTSVFFPLYGPKGEYLGPLGGRAKGRIQLGWWADLPD